MTTPLSKPTQEIEGPKQMPGRVGEALRHLSKEGVGVKKVFTDLLDVPMKRGDDFTDDMIDKLIEEAEQVLRDAAQAVRDLSFEMQVKRHEAQQAAMAAESAAASTERTIDWGDAGGDGDPDNPGT